MRAVTALALLAALAAAATAGAAPAPAPGTIIPLSKPTFEELSKNIGTQPILFIANVKLKPGADVDKFIAVREAVVAKARKTFTFPSSVAYFKGAMPAKTETLPQGAAKLSYFPVGVIVTFPDAKSYASYNAHVAKVPDYVASGKAVEEVVRSVNLQS